MDEWVKEFPCVITVCDRDGVIIEMNDRSIESNKADGGKDLIGRNLLDCHPEPSKTQLQRMLVSGKANTYTVEKNGVRKFVHQAPWYSGGEYRGIVEIVIPIPADLPHRIRS